MLLMKYIILTIFPIWEVLLIRWKSNNWFFIVIHFFEFFSSRTNFEVFKSVTTCSFHTHLMWVDDFAFFFEVKSLTVFQHDGVLELLLKVFLVAWKQSFRVWISNKFISATCFSTSAVSTNGIISMICFLVWSCSSNSSWSIATTHIFSIFSIHNFLLSFSWVKNKWLSNK